MWRLVKNLSAIKFLNQLITEHFIQSRRCIEIFYICCYSELEMQQRNIKLIN